MVCKAAKKIYQIWATALHQGALPLSVATPHQNTHLAPVESQIDVR